jgi:C4-dicarboxylate transporter, DctM subunit
VALLIALVLGSIYTGIATATEAAGIGVVASLALAAAQGTLTVRTFVDGVLSATRLYCMIALILAGSSFLTLSMGYIGLPRQLAEGMAGLGLSQAGLIALLAVFFIVLGCFLDGISMVLLTIGVLMPTVLQAGIDPLWFGIFLILVVELAQITPPVGFNLFVLQGMTQREITWLARVSLPPFLVLVLGLVLIYLFPAVVTWLPGRM